MRSLLGKSTNLSTLSAALTDLHARDIQDPDGFFRPVDNFVLNPKSVSVDELYGKFNLTTQEWKNGIVATLVRETVNRYVQKFENILKFSKLCHLY